ncbi:cyclin-dependent kinase inhibitor 3-like isoform X2 [Malania oleifera]|uniref:cyclin-dependent kinase inhibitor 3-like isoform X2 n=1 Tax=Malania oleifera TaxID=397392 RepID=UPI0025AE8D0F|nr:cyclin-dependent kinase inhibitor 3-like isoform X2 [Malania oleifera]
MGKYMKKAKIRGDVAVMEVSQSSLGVLTRAKTLALQRLRGTLPPPTHRQSPQSPEPAYLELRSRRLEKPSLLSDPKKHNQSQAEAPRGTDCYRNPRLSTRSTFRPRPGLANSGSVSLGSPETLDVKEDEAEDAGIEASFGENNLELEGRDRNTRESTPCSLIRDSTTIRTPGSTTRQRNMTAATRRVLNAMQGNIPSTNEMEEFFAYAEQQQHRLFTEKYNFDVVNDLPLPGLYEWVRVNP